MLEEARSLALLAGDKITLGLCSLMLASMIPDIDHGDRINFLEESVAHLQEADHPNEYYAIYQLATAYLREGKKERGRMLLERIASDESAFLPYKAPALSLLGSLARWRGDADAARAHDAEAERLLRESSEARRVHGLGGMGHAMRSLGEYDRAEAFYAASLRLRLKFRQNPEASLNIALSLEDFGVLASLRGDYERCARLFGAAETQAAILNRSLPVAVPLEYWPAEAEAREVLGEKAYAKEWAEGRAMTMDDAVAFALGKDADG
jgi:hypothetical protein